MTTTRPRPTAYPLLVLLCALAVLIAPGAAQGQGSVEDGQDQLTWSVQPADTEHGTQRANYAYALEPGAELTDAMVVTNASSRELTLAVYAADGYTTPSGHLDLQPADTPATGLGSWVTPEVDEVTLDPGESQEIPFTLAVPEDASPGDHPGGIVTSYVTGEDSGTVRLDRRLGSRIHVRVAGEQEVSLTVSDLQVDQPFGANPVAPVTTTVRYTLTNTGNVRTLGHERLTVAGPGGLLAVQPTGVAIDEIMPGSSIDREIEVDGTWPLGRVSAQLEITPEAVAGTIAPAVDSEATTWAVPWVWIGVLVLLIALSVWLGMRRAGQSSASTAAKPDAPTANTTADGPAGPPASG